MGSKKRSNKGISKVKRQSIKGNKITKGKRRVPKSTTDARKALKQRLKKFNSRGNKETEVEVNAEDILDMIDDDDRDLSHLKSENFRSKMYFVKPNQKVTSHVDGEGKKQTRLFRGVDHFEEAYEHKAALEEDREQNRKAFLPIKTSEGLQVVTDEIENMEVSDVEEDTIQSENELNSDQVSSFVGPKSDGIQSEISFATLMARRRRAREEYKTKIGMLASSCLEKPEDGLKNIESLMNMQVNPGSTLSYGVPKMASASLVAIFQDILPTFPIKNISTGVKEKDSTRELKNYERRLLDRYKSFLKILEKLISQKISQKRPPKFERSAGFKLALHYLSCFCDLLVSHPYFNYSKNIVNLLVPLLNSWCQEARLMVSNALATSFKADKRGEITFEVVRRINMFIKNKKNKGIRRELIDLLLNLRIKDINLESEKKEELVSNKNLTFEKRRMLSKQGRKHAKEMKKLERELLEASAEESKQKKHHFIKESTKIVFTIFFRVLKLYPKGELLSAVLEGVAKFGHLISIEYFGDLLKLLENLTATENLSDRQHLLCITTVLSILDGQGSALTIDPLTFHQQLFSLIFKLPKGSDATTGLALRSVDMACSKRKMPSQRSIAFIKRLSHIAVHFSYKEALGTLAEIRRLMRTTPASRTLVDCEECSGSGVYIPHLDDPDQCNANSTLLWELQCLTAFYHPWVRKLASTIGEDSVSPIPSHINVENAEDLCLGIGLGDFFEGNESPVSPSQISFPKKTQPKEFSHMESIADLICSEL